MPAKLPNPGVWGNDVYNQQVNQANSATAIWALMLGALQQIAAGGGGGGGGGGLSAVNLTQILGAAISAANALPTNISGFTATGSTTVNPVNVSTSGTVAAGKIHIEFLLSSDFVGSIGGATINNTSGTLAIGQWSCDVPPTAPTASLAYTITGGSAILTAY